MYKIVYCSYLYYKLHSICRFAVIYSPHRELSLDEGTIPWYGRLSFRVYNPAKPVKYGIKSYMVCDSTNGYCLKYEVYTGKTEEQPSPNGKLYDLIMRNLVGYYGMGYRLYCDNYYSSSNLFLDLWQLRVGATGTLRLNRRGIAQQLKDCKLKDRGDKFVMNKGPLMAMKFLDRKPVTLLSTVHSSKEVPTGKLDRQTGEALTHPEVVQEYNKYMGGVDRADQMMSYVTFRGRTLKWWKRLFFHLISLSLMNAYILHKEHVNKQMKHRVYRREVAASMISDAGQVCNSQGGKGRPSAAHLVRLTGRHFPSKIVGTGKKTNVTRMCQVCGPAERQAAATGDKRKRYGHESSYECKQCEVALCVAPCFELYHTKQEYILAYKRLHAASEQ